MADLFLASLHHTLQHEGGFVDHPADPGGATNWGVSLRALRNLEADNVLDYDRDGDGDVDADDMRMLTRADAQRFYREHFWFPWMDLIVVPRAASKAFDTGVNVGPRQAARLLQRAANIVLRDPIKADGWIGEKSIEAINTIGQAEMGSRLVTAMTHVQARFYFDLVDAKPARNAFLLGWLRRAYWKP